MSQVPRCCVASTTTNIDFMDASLHHVCVEMSAYLRRFSSMRQNVYGISSLWATAGISNQSSHAHKLHIIQIFSNLWHERWFMRILQIHWKSIFLLGISISCSIASERMLMEVLFNKVISSPMSNIDENNWSSVFFL